MKSIFSIGHTCQECNREFATPENNPVRIVNWNSPQNCFCSFTCAKQFRTKKQEELKRNIAVLLEKN